MKTDHSHMKLILVQVNFVCFIFTDNRQDIECINISVFICSSLSLDGWEFVSVLQLACNDFGLRIFFFFFPTKLHATVLNTL